MLASRDDRYADPPWWLTGTTRVKLAEHEQFTAIAVPAVLIRQGEGTTLELTLTRQPRHRRLTRIQNYQELATKACRVQPGATSEEIALAP